MKTRADVARLMEEVFEECKKTHGVANQEYALDTDALANFNEVAKDAGISRLSVWYILASKHWRGVASYIRGFKSQRENVRGRIKDLIVYLVLLWAMINDDEEEQQS